MMPILQHCINSEHKGVQVILIYPLKALAKDQKERLDCYLSNVNNLFIDEIAPNKWDDIQTWESLFESKIKLLWKKYELGFYNFLEKYFEITNIDRSKCELVDVWIEKFEEFIDFQKRITKESKNKNIRKQNIYNYFQEAGLLPDYAFGSGGPKLIIKSKSDNTIRDIIMGYRLEEICPPSSLDHGKARYACEKIWMGNALKTVALKFKECKSCNNNIIFTKPGINKCPLCGSPLIQVDREIKEPRIIEGKKSYVKKPRKVVFEKRVFDLPENLKVSGLVSPPFSCEVGSFFRTGVRGNETKPCVYCENCGRITFREDEKCCRYSKEIDPSFAGKGRTIIGTKFKTRGIIVDIPNTNKKTLLNALIAAAVLEAGCEPGEIDGIEDAVDGKLLLFDNVEGGVGFVDVLYNRLKDVLKTAKRLCEMDCCQNGCIKCIGSYWRQHEIPMLRKRDIIKDLDDMINKL
jgi:RNA polymerase subunit RPABC4/transcription elongation factor Spt4